MGAIRKGIKDSAELVFVDPVSLASYDGGVGTPEQARDDAGRLPSLSADFGVHAATCRRAPYQLFGRL